ncbi:MAG: molybdenum cofactor guanylyltransferase, partial [Candidatus Dormibacteria bacterium]
PSARVQPAQVRLLILAGGSSQRMGRDKPAIEFPGPGGEPLIHRVGERLRFIPGPPLLAGPSDYGTGWPRVADDDRFQGPAAGLVAGLLAAEAELVLAVAADLPFAGPELARGLIGLAQSHRERAAVVPLHRGRLEPLFAAYRPWAARLLLEMADGASPDGRGLALRDLLRVLEPLTVPEETWRPWDPEGRSFHNCNTPGELLQAAAWERAPGAHGGKP